MFFKYEFDSKLFTGATPEDCKMIHKALSDGVRLMIDPEERIIDESGRYIADGKRRQ